MKAKASDAARYLARPDPQLAGCLIYGADAMRVAHKRQDFLARLLGPDAEREMRLTRIQASSLRSDPAQILDAVKAVGFFAGARAVFIEDAGDGASVPLEAALAEWRAGDAHIIVTAGVLATKSSLRKLFEASPVAYAIAIYDDPPSAEEIRAELARAGLQQIAPAAQRDLEALARALDPGDFRNLLEKIALYKLGDAAALTSDEVASLAPATIEAEIDEILNATAEGDAPAVGRLMARLGPQGVGAVALCIAATRHFRALYAVSCHSGGVEAGIGALKPPVFGPRRDRMLRQVQRWGADMLQEALAHLVETDLALRSAQQAPQMALMERCLIRLAMKPRGRPLQGYRR